MMSIIHHSNSKEFVIIKSVLTEQKQIILIYTIILFITEETKRIAADAGNISAIGRETQ